MARTRDRRTFLRDVGITGGAGALFATMGALGLAPTARAEEYRPPRGGDLSTTGRRAAKVVVIGGGIAGLTTAYELGKAGYDCTVLEARARTGGRNFTVRAGDRTTDLYGHTQTARFADGQYLNAGPARIPQWMVTLDYCRELGVPIEVFTNVNADAYLYNESAGMTAPVRHRTAKADVYGYVSELLAKATDQGALDEQLTSTDRERLVEFLKDWGELGDRLTYDGGERRGYATVPAAAGTPGVPLGNVPSASEVFASGVGRYFSFEFGFDQAMLMFQPVGGMDRIPLALTRAVGAHRVRTGAVVSRITDTGRGVTVTYTQAGRTKAVDADYAVAALPPNILAKVPHNLGSGVQSALEAITPSSAAKIGLEYRSRWWELDHRIYGGITETDQDVVHIWHPSYGFGGERGVLVGYYNYGANADAYARLRPEERERRAVAAGVKIYGEKYRSELVSSFSHHWRQTPHLEAAWHSTPGGPDDVRYKPLNEPTGRVWFAGDWLSYTDAWQHGAFTSARRAVTSLHARVLAS
ncbi:NAD(P)/FAD-dependent oxidoreductase [Streptomyces acidiscabies]|uniref:FAD-dependent oxidoreductase n=1 Tax=Streptomyces acidiscabies TaxID=42234 RepID=A0AAP6EDI7_9ACTN|nr:FAD-dependent oxidoreductase [Streptomyces acidiscabies]MBP5940289.1 FAD-dependent oxidoreductase [Streptomyces sp. LBUM 1476]MBZ3911520.1 FAD-dependent oxidoreductase [Streptomyces acidiscabies]MDX2958744.1 FAD-dependent oxidoreductase [Streptomyces acidiscabies]MDX3018182.1 FAD-dependent oxidoreductase [Streptomyces acidiscabies]MDX3791579.1 FAD-dependent oxidoreductase [Streptomyces acidiscabies]